MSKPKNGFTIIELLVSATIIAVLVAIGVVSYASVGKHSRDTKRLSDIEQLRSALEMYRADKGFYPDTGASWVPADPNLNSFLVPTYMPVIPSDPKGIGFDYNYEPTNLSGGNYYGYCLTAFLEVGTATGTCAISGPTPPAGTHAYGVKNP